MNVFHAFILALVEGLTEFLPVSSTGHMILASDLLGLPDSAFLTSFEIVIQFGAILAVVALYWRRFLMDTAVLKRVAVAFVPTAAVGFASYKLIKIYLLGNSSVVLWSLLIGGAVIIAFESWHGERLGALADLRQMSWRQAALVGLFQALAVIPGVSRSAATVIAGLWLGIRRDVIVEFSFLLAVPTMAAAAGYDLLKSHDAFEPGQAGLLAVGFVASFLFALLAIRLFVGYVRRHNFSVFGVYRILLALFMFWWLA